MQQTDKKLQDTYIDVTLAKVDIKDIKENLTVVQSDVSDMKSNFTTTQTALREQMQINRRMSARSPFSFPPNPNRSGVASVNIANSTDCVMKGRGCS